jgi:hypothetical protein
MDTAVSATAPSHYIERRRAQSVPPHGTVVPERRRPVFVVDVEDLDDRDLQGVLADGLDYGVGSDDAVAAAASLAALIVCASADALAAHDLGR